MKYLFLCGILNIFVSHAMEQNMAFQSDRQLHQAVERNDIGAMQSLLAQGADATAYDQRGYTPLHYVMSVAAAQLLLQYHADPTAPEEKIAGHGPLHNLVQREGAECPQTVEFLIKSGAMVNAPNKYGTRPLDLVNWESPTSCEMVRALLKNGATIKYANPTSDVPGNLDAVIFHGNTKLAQLLLEFGCDATKINRNSVLFLEGKVPYCDRSEIAALIQERNKK